MLLFRGSARAQINFNPISFATFLSIPPGLEAKSINRLSLCTFCKDSCVNIKCGTVFIIMSYFDKSPKLFMLVYL